MNIFLNCNILTEYLDFGEFPKRVLKTKAFVNDEPFRTIRGHLKPSVKGEELIWHIFNYYISFRVI